MSGRWLTTMGGTIPLTLSLWKGEEETHFRHSQLPASQYYPSAPSSTPAPWSSREAFTGR